MKKLFFTCLMIFLLYLSIFGSDKTNVLPGMVTFLPRAPSIDGILDQEINHLPKRALLKIEKSAESNPLVNLHFRLAYGTDFFYIYLEVAQTALNVRDRGYQNGDGFHMVLGLPKKGNAPTDEFYVLGFTPTQKPDSKWQRKFIWYRNVDAYLNPLPNTQFQEKIQQDKIGFEVLIPWDDIYPYHPWISESLGFNLCYVQAVGETDNNFFFLLKDKRIQSEQSLRKYIKLHFSKPSLNEGVQSAAVLTTNHLFPDQDTRLIIATLSADKNRLVGKLFIKKDTKTIHEQPYRIQVKKGVTVSSIKPNTDSLTPNQYTLQWQQGKEIPFNLLPAFDVAEITRGQTKIRPHLVDGSLATLQFRIAFIESQLERLKPYEKGDFLQEAILDVLKIIRTAEQGIDLLDTEKKAGVTRRAFRSRLDNTLQPYTISLPDGYSTHKKYPLLVWLHGSGVDDRGLPRPIIPIFKNFIILAPKGRGISHAYCKNNAQIDIREAISAVRQNFSIDDQTIILAGFSMGGYGVYRTFYEDQQGFKALAVFAGHPNLSYGDINFLDEKNLSCFKGVDIFIYHGDRDRNCEIEKTLELVEHLKKIGANVTFQLEKDKGHEAPGMQTILAFIAWLDKILKK